MLHTTTYKELMGRLHVIRNGPAGSMAPGPAAPQPLARRPLSGGLMLALRRFVRLADEHLQDFEAARKALLAEMIAAGADPSVETPPVFQEKFEEILNTEVSFEVPALPLAQVMEENISLTLEDLDILSPIVEE